MSLIWLGTLASAAGEKVNWICSIVLNTPRGLAMNADNNVFLSISGGYTIRFDALGQIVWQRRLTSSVSFRSGLAVDGSRVYVAGTNPTNLMNFNAYTLAGSLSYQRSINPSNDSPFLGEIALDGTSVYAAGYSGNTAPRLAYLAKMATSNGARTWERTLRGTSTTLTHYWNSVSVDTSDGNVLVAGNSESGSLPAMIAEYSSAGTLSYSRVLSDGATEAHSIVSDNAGSFYVSYGASARRIAKFDSSLNLVWAKTFTSIVGGAQTISLDSAGNLYWLVSQSISSVSVPTIIKFDSSGNIIWQRQLRLNIPAATSLSSHRLVPSADGTNFALTVGYGSASDRCYVLYLPANGGLTNAYTIDGRTLTYEVSSLTLTDATPSLSTHSTTVASPTYTHAAGALTDTATTLSTITIGI